MSPSCPPAGESGIPTAEALFHEMLALPPDQWGDYLEQACPPDREPALHAEVMGLLHGHEQAGGFLPFETVTSPMFRRPAVPLPEKPGDQIGPYKLMEQIGEGGFGVVWVADQEKPVRRRVALKILKPGMDTKQVIARFEQERQALAMMDHPNIARVLDAGATPFGRPFFVMELVKGVKITQYCDQAHLPTKDRLRLFIAVCQAVQHAHQKGVIHRDLKPSNILVTLHDGVPVPKVIDFGVAKATQQQRLTDLTIYTQFEQMIGTPLYMSPEQAELSGLDIDTRSDIYSLGVLLYELLTGRTPFDPEALMKRGLEEIRRAVREQEPQKPSTFVSTLALDLRTDLARRRQTDSAKLVGQIRGDLDWIVMKALEKDRARRYETATGLAHDIQRHLGSEPVLARPPTMGYRFRRFARRHKATFAAAAAVLTALVLGLGTTTWMFYMERRARLRAVAAELAQEQERKKAESEADKSRQVAQFLTDMLKGVGPAVALGRDTTLLREILDKTADRLGQDLKDQPEIEGYLRFHLGGVYSELGDDPKAEAMFREALEKQKQLAGDDNENVASGLEALAHNLANQGNLSEAEAMGREVLAMRRKLLGNEDLLVVSALNNLALTLSLQGNLTEAESMRREALAMARKLLANEHPEVAASLLGLAAVVSDQGRLAEAESLYREVLDLERNRLGQDHPDVAITLNNFAIVLQDQNKTEEAEAMLRKALAMQQKLLGPDHPHVATSLNNLVLVLQAQKKTAAAEAMCREVLAMRRKLFGNEHPSLATSLSNLATLLTDQGKMTEAETLYREVLAMRRKLFGNEHPDLAITLVKLAATLRSQDKLSEAEPLFREGLAIQRKVLAKEHPQLAITLNDLAAVLATKKEYTEAEPLSREALTIQRSAVGHGKPEISLAQLLHNLATTLYEQSKYIEAEALYREALAIRKNHLGHEHLDVANSLRHLGMTLQSQGKSTEAELLLREALAIRKNRLGHEHLDVAVLLHTLAHTVEKNGDINGAESLHREALEMFRKLSGPEDSVVAQNAACLARMLLAAKNFTAAEPFARESVTIREKKLPDDWLTFSARNLLGGSLLGQKRFAEAEPLLLSGYEGMKQREAKIPAAGRPNLHESVQRLVQLYEAVQKPAQAAAWKRELDARVKADAVPESGAKDDLQPR